MDITAHTVTLLSIVIGIGLTEMFGNFHKLIRNRARVTWDWLPVVWATALLIIVINYWWGIYLGAGGINQASNAAEFGLILIPAILLFLSTASVLPNFSEDRDWNMRQHYDEQHKTFILTFILYQCSTWATSIVTGSQGWNFSSFARVIVLLLLVCVLFVSKRWLDWIVVLLIMAIVIFRLTTQVVK